MGDLHLLCIGSDFGTADLFTSMNTKVTHTPEHGAFLSALSQEVFDGVILDISGGMDAALRMAERIRSVKKHLFILIITAHPDQETLLRAISLGINEVLLTPYEADKVVDIIRKIRFSSQMNRQLLKKNHLLNQYKNALDASLIISKTDKNGIINYVNDKFCEISEYLPSEIIGQTHRLFKHPETTKEQMTELWKTIQSKRVWHGTIANRTKSGAAFYSDTFILPLLDERNEIDEYMDMRIDITEIKNYLRIIQSKVEEAREEILLQQQQLIAQSRAAALGEMLDNIAHQWRQPIGAINNAIINAEFAIELTGIDPKQILETFASITHYTAFLSKTIDDFRNFSHPDKEKSTFSLHESITQTIEIIRGAYEMNHISLSYDPDAALRSVQVFGPQGELSQVILNVLSNARDAVKENKSGSGDVRIDLCFRNETVTLTISDNAGGIPESVLPKIFDPYFTTKNKAQGTGIGLYMSKTIVEKHFEGKIEALNGDEGAVFTITLPIAKNGEAVPSEGTGEMIVIGPSE